MTIFRIDHRRQLESHVVVFRFERVSGRLDGVESGLCRIGVDDGRDRRPGPVADERGRYSGDFGLTRSTLPPQHAPASAIAQTDPIAGRFRTVRKHRIGRGPAASRMTRAIFVDTFPAWA